MWELADILLLICLCEMTIDLETQLIEKGNAFVTYSLIVYETTDTTDMAQLAIFIRGVDSNLCIWVETTRKDFKKCLSVTTRNYLGTNLLDLQKIRHNCLI